ncbi:DUF4249 family protein [Gracilimonas mengyeensis]|uniref:DUF4249 domain-containing protein n=1 Tax=Gracilimonas mengyeensis TaxID=1302730 RepID=A0A521FNJ5_9BACT|nr:DUF4249 family protein [Gracilimonas mengyeensis]SMO97768.1 protein of unknown function [Gracilimonas mengyeensis]
MKNLLTLLLITAAAALVSCETYPQDDYEEYYVVEAYLVADRQLPHVRLSKTVPADEVYDFSQAAINNANVAIQLLESGPESTVEQTYSYSFSMQNPGIYWADVSHHVLPSRTYRLHITFPDSDDEITATTIIPGGFDILEGVRDTIVYQSSEQLEITVSESSYPGRQNIFIFNALSDNPVAENLTPVYFDFYEDGDEDPEDLELFANNSSGIINEGNFEKNPDGSITIDYPWIGIAYYGENKIVANTLDDNIYDFIRSQEVQLGGSTLSPGEIQNVIYNIEGGIGVFGALASDTVETFVKRNPAIN